MKNLFYREQEARQVLELDYKELSFECKKHMELRIASDRDLVNCYKSLQKLNEDCEALRAQLKELEEAAADRKALGAAPGRPQDRSTGGSPQGSPKPLGGLCEAHGEVDPEVGLGLHEVLLPEGPSGSSRWRGSRQLHR
jgi:hypothetical protein